MCVEIMHPGFCYAHGKLVGWTQQYTSKRLQAMRSDPSQPWTACDWNLLQQEVRAAQRRTGATTAACDSWQVQLRAPVSQLKEWWKLRLEVRVWSGRQVCLPGIWRCACTIRYNALNLPGCRYFKIRPLHSGGTYTDRFLVVS